ncbi:hypothetical protein L6R52_41070, partial [Myxococcota bacterium]|nr:hypothetical protein [Myxococcota bacterium]
MSPPTEPRPRPRARVRRGLRVVAIAVAGAFLLVAVSLVGLRVYFSDARLTALIPRLLEDRLLGSFRVGRLRWVLPFDVVAEHVVVLDPAGREVLVVERLEATLDPLPLFDTHVHVTRGHLSGALVRLFPPVARGPDAAAVSLLEAFEPRGPPSGAPSPWTALVEHVSASELDVVLEWPTLEAALDGSLLSGGRVDLGRDHLRVAGSVQSTRLSVRPVADEPGRAEDLSRGTPVQKGKSPESGRGSVIGPLAISIDGPVDDLAITLATESRPAVLVGLPIGTLTVALALRGGEATIDRFEAAWPEGAVRVRGAVESPPPSPVRLALCLGGGAPARLCRFAWRAELDARGLAVRERLGPLIGDAPLPAVVTGTISVVGRSLAELDADVELDLALDGLPPEPSRGLVRAAHVTGRVSLLGDRARFDPLVVDVGERTLRLVGRVPLDPRGVIDAHVEVHERRPGALFAALGVPLEATSAGLRIDVEGTFAAPRARGIAWARGFGRSDLARGALELPFTLDDGVFTLSGAELATGAGRARFDGRVRVFEPTRRPPAASTPALPDLSDRPGWPTPLPSPEITGALSLEGLDLGGPTRGVVDGGLSGMVRGQLSRGRLSASGVIDAGEYSIRGATVTVSRVDLSATEAEVTIGPTTIAPAGGGVVGVRGRYAWAGTLAAIVDARDLSVRSLARLAGSSAAIDGRVSAHTRVVGAAQAPVVTATISAGALTLDGEGLGAATATVSGDPALVDAHVTLRSAAGVVRGAARLCPELGTIAAEVRAVGLDLGALPFVASRVGSLGGRVSVEATAIGALTDPRVQGRVHLSALTFAGAPLGRGSARFDVASIERGPGWVIDVDALGVVRAHARLVPRRTLSHRTGTPGTAVEPGDPGDALPVSGELRAELDDLSLAALFPELAAQDVDVITSGELRVEVGEARGALEAQLVLPRLRARLGPETLHAVRPIRASYRDGRLVLDEVVVQGPSGTFTAGGTAGAQLALFARGHLDLAFVAALVPEL